MSATLRKSSRRKDEEHGRAVVYARSGGVCERCGNQRATEWHHRKPRSLSGRWNPANGMHLDHDCHQWITDAGVKTTEPPGWTVPSHRDPALTPVMYRGVRVLLGDDGTVTPCDHYAGCAVWTSDDPDDCDCREAS